MKIVADANIPFVKECFSHIGEVEIVAGRDVSSDIVRDADALLVRSITKVNAGLLEGSGVKFAATATIGVDHIDQEYLSSKNIGFSSAPGSNATSVAEYVTCALLEVARKYDIELEGKKLGIIGVGNVGSRVEKRARVLGMIPVLNDPPLKRQSGDEKYRPIDEIFGCDFVTIHTPLTKEGEDATYHLADSDFFAKLKDGAVFVNSSRGGVVENDAIKEALKSGKVQAAILDVWETEPNVDNELLGMVDIASPHIAGYSYDGKVAGMIMIYEALCKHFGITIEHSAADFVPEPIVPIVDAASLRGDVQEKIRQVATRVYNILQDDSDTRKIAMRAAGEQAAFFDSLRKNYPIRREFANTTVKGATGELAQKLEGLGFKMA